MQAAQKNGNPNSSKLKQEIRDRIAQVTGGRIHELEVELIDDRVVIRGYTASYYLKQLALQGVLDVVGGAGAINLEFNIRVMTNPPRLKSGMD
jgi:hypothetical protein